MDSKATHGKEQKYFFTENIFDDDYIKEPPPPSFSEQELSAAKLQEFAEGKRTGLKEAEAAQLRQVSQTLQHIQKHLVQLGSAESLREKIFEQEVLKLTLAIFEKLFPLYNQQAGFEELKHSLTDLIKKQEGQNSVLIAIDPAIAAEIETHMDTLRDSGLEVKFTVKPDEAFTGGACRLSWANGGAVRDPEALAEEIRASIQQVLAKKAPKGHDSETGLAPDGEAV